MARFKLLEAHVFGAVRLKAGSTIADTAGNAVEGDTVITTLSPQTITHAMAPLDSQAEYMRNASPHSTTPLAATITGVHSIG